MTKPISILIVDDHPIIVEAYKSALEHLNKNDDTVVFNINSAINTDDVLKKLTFSNFDIVFLDIRIPPSSDNTIISGEDLGLKIREKLPTVKIVVSTMFNDNTRINSIFKTLDPDAFLIKDDITKSTIIDALQSVLDNQPFYSKTVLKLLRKIAKNDYILDKIDRQLLFYLSKGIKTKDLTQHIALSSTGIERRKRQLKAIFGKENCSDSELLRVAEEKGFI
ncbi:response regulator [Winogradskyella sp.]|uniref:response regulator n=1 Tax=Winogradskyella sp. TaxID=1883156 RepID=UPI002615927C|nr:response regulator [Winogradskyella sp.]